MGGKRLGGRKMFLGYLYKGLIAGCEEKSRHFLTDSYAIYRFLQNYPIRIEDPSNHGLLCYQRARISCYFFPIKANDHHPYPLMPTAALIIRATVRIKNKDKRPSRSDLTVSSAHPPNNSWFSHCLQNHLSECINGQLTSILILLQLEIFLNSKY